MSVTKVGVLCIILFRKYCTVFCISIVFDSGDVSHYSQISGLGTYETLLGSWTVMGNRGSAAVVS